ncbi:MAG: CDP-glycerol glycerophosphotransferase family protein [Chloroflexota bacterium]
MSPLEFRLSWVVLGLVALLARLVPVRRNRVVLATARLPALEGNLLHLHDAIRARRPDVDLVSLLQPYSYDLAGKVRYLLRLVRATFVVHTSGLVVVDNAYLPVHVVPHRAGVTVVQVWHAPGALKRFGADTLAGLDEPERTFLHRHYDYVVAPGEAGRDAWARALRTPLERVLALGTPRTDVFFDAAALEAARARLLAAHPELRGRRVVLYAPTFRGRGRAKHGTAALDGRRLRARLPATHALVVKSHPNLDPATQPVAGFDVVADPASDMNDWLALADVFVTDYSSSIFEWALLHRPLVLLVDDLEAYERDPGLYLDYRSEMIGAQVRDTDGVADAVLRGDVDEAAFHAFVARNIGACDGHASDRFVDRFLPPGGGR